MSRLSRIHICNFGAEPLWAMDLDNNDGPKALTRRPQVPTSEVVQDQKLTLEATFRLYRLYQAVAMVADPVLVVALPGRSWRRPPRLSEPKAPPMSGPQLTKWPSRSNVNSLHNCPKMACLYMANFNPFLVSFSAKICQNQKLLQGKEEGSDVLSGKSSARFWSFFRSKSAGGEASQQGNLQKASFGRRSQGEMSTQNCFEKKIELEHPWVFRQTLKYAENIWKFESLKNPKSSDHAFSTFDAFCDGEFSPWPVHDEEEGGVGGSRWQGRVDQNLETMKPLETHWKPIGNPLETHWNHWNMIDLVKLKPLVSIGTHQSFGWAVKCVLMLEDPRFWSKRFSKHKRMLGTVKKTVDAMENHTIWPLWLIGLMFWVNHYMVCLKFSIVKGSLGIYITSDYILRVAAEDLSTKRCDHADVIQQRCETWEMWSRRCDTAEMWDMRTWRVGIAGNAVFFFHSFVASLAGKVSS